MAREKMKLVLNVPADVRAWIEQQSGQRRMTMSEYCVRLMTRGILAEETDQAVERLREASAMPAQDALLRELLAVRYIVEQHAKGSISMPATLGTNANEFAERELVKRAGKG
jgi:hypothetical protein